MVRKLAPPIFKTFDTRDLEPARAGLKTIYSAPATVDLLEKRASFGMRMRAADLGSLTLARVEIANWRLTRDAGECVVLTLPLAGAGQYRRGNIHRSYAGQEGIAVARPLQTYAVDCLQGTGMGLTLPAEALLAQVERLTGETASASLLLQTVDEIDVTVSVGRTLARTMKAAMAELTDLAAVGMGGLASANYDELLLNLAIATLFPQIAEALGQTPADCGSTVIRRAHEYIHGHAAEPINIGRLAADLGVSMRAMQENFQRRYGLSPRAYLMDCRLEIARQRFKAQAPGSSVTEIALESGFSDLSHFAAKYREKYGEPPSETLRAAHGGSSDAAAGRMAPAFDRSHNDSRSTFRTEAARRAFASSALWPTEKACAEEKA